MASNKHKSFKLIITIFCGLTISGQLVINLSAKDVQPQPPAIPKLTLQSPISFFRTMLETNREAREQFLSEKPPEQRKILEAKFNEYLTLPPDERELRLFMTELRWYLLIILRNNPTNRTALMEQIPDRYKSLVTDRVKHWEKLPSDLQKELIENEFALQYILRLNDNQNNTAVLSSLHPQQQAKVQQLIANWNRFPEQRKKTIIENFNKLFELSPQEQQSALKILPAGEKIRMEKTLSAFSGLSKEERERCIASFKKFSSMSESEREQFLRNAAKWAEISPEERDAWRNIVRSFQSNRKIELPPLPPGMVQEATANLHSPNIKPAN